MCVCHQTECEPPGCEWRWSVWAWQHLHNTNGSDKEDVLQCEAVCSQSSPPSPHCANINWHTVTRGRRAATRTQRDTAASPPPPSPCCCSRCSSSVYCLESGGHSRNVFIYHGSDSRPHRDPAGNMTPCPCPCMLSGPSLLMVSSSALL